MSAEQSNPSEQFVHEKTGGQNGDEAGLPVASAEDVEFAEELADEDDLEAQQRAEEADVRANAYEGE